MALTCREIEAGNLEAVKAYRDGGGDLNALLDYNDCRETPLCIAGEIAPPTRQQVRRLTLEQQLGAGPRRL